MDQGTGESPSEIEAARRKPWRGRLLIGCSTLFVQSIALACAWLYHLIPVFRPSERALARTETMLSDYASSHWGDKVELDHVDIGQEIQDSDFPPSTWKAYEYQAYFRITGTQAIFFAGIPVHARPADLWHYGAMSYELTPDEIALLTAYSHETSTAASGWGSDADWSFYAGQFPGKDVWSVEPVALGEPWSSGSGVPDAEWVFERLDDGSFRLLRQPVE